MTIKRLALQVVRLAVAAVLSLTLIVFLSVQIQQRILRWRAERLMADMHQIRLYQSTWADAQRFMHRWGLGAITKVAARRPVASTTLK
jgi:hypothetical protein